MVAVEEIEKLEERLYSLELKQDRIIDMLQRIASFVKTSTDLEYNLDLSLKILEEQ